MFTSLPNFLFLVHVLVAFPCTVTQFVLKSLVLRGGSPWSHLRSHPSPTLCGWNRAHCSFRLSGVSGPPPPLRPSCHQAAFPQGDISSAGNLPSVSTDQAMGRTRASGSFEERWGKGVRRSGGLRALVHHCCGDLHGHGPCQDICKEYHAAT